MLWQPILHVNAMSSSDYVNHRTCYSPTNIRLGIEFLGFAERITLFFLTNLFVSVTNQTVVPKK